MTNGAHLIVTVHGIRTFGQWQRRLQESVAAQDPDVTFCHFTYGYFSILAFIFPPTRWILVRRFRRELVSLITRTNPARVDVIGHSFGTHLIGWALRGLAKEAPIKIDTVILAGSVLRSGFFWADLIPFRVRRVVNDCGVRDTVLLASQFLVPLTGMAGRIGFVGMNGNEFTNRYSMFGHSGYFRGTDGADSNDYMLKNWVPLLVGERKLHDFDERLSPTAWRGLLIWITNNFEPVKIMLPMSLLVAGLVWLGALYIEANAAKERMTAVIDLGEAMKQKGDANVQTNEVLDTLQQALAVPLRRTYLLWVDDNPDNNFYERRALRRFGLCFIQVTSTEAALRLLEGDRKKFSVVISDFLRPRDPQAGYGLLDQIKEKKLAVPLIYYVSRFSEEQARQAQARGAVAQVTGVLDLTAVIFKTLAPEDKPVGRFRLVAQELEGCDNG
jgi:CheY-like chemotaxis protein